MSRISRLMGVILWLFSLNLFVATYGGRLAKNPWLDIALGLGMFMTACYLLGDSLPGSSDLKHALVLLLILMSSALLTARINGRTQFQWYDMMVIVAAPQVVAMIIGYLLAYRRQPHSTPLNC